MDNFESLIYQPAPDKDKPIVPADTIAPPPVTPPPVPMPVIAQEEPPAAPTPAPTTPTDFESLAYQPAPPVPTTPGYDLLTNLYNKDTPPPAAPTAPTTFDALAYKPDPMLTPSKIAQLPGTAPEEQGSFAHGITAGIQTSKETYYALKGLAQKALGDKDGFRDSLSLAALYDNSAGALAPKYGIVDSVRYGTVGDMISSLGYALGTQVPTIATMIATGGVAGGITKMAAEAYTKKLISKEIRDELISTAVKRATLAGAYVSTTTMETGSTATEAYQATGDVNTGAALLAGGVKGALELVVPAGLAGKLGFGKAIDAGLLDTIESFVAKGFGKSTLGQAVGGTVGTAVGAGVEEATTEAAQETIDAAARAYVDKNYKFLSAATRDRILEAAATGGLVGMVFGAAAGGGGHGAHAGHEIPSGPATTEVGNRAAAAISGEMPQTPMTTPAVTSQPPAPGSAITVPGGVASSPSAEVGAVRGSTNGAVPTLDDLPKKIDLNTLQTAPGLVIPPAAIPHVTQAVIKRNAAVRLANRNASPVEIAKATAAAQQALTAAHAAGLSYATGTPTDAPVLPGGTAVGGGPAPATTGATASNIPPATPTVATKTPGTPGPGGTTTAGPAAIPAAAGGTGTISPTTTAPATAQPEVIPPDITAETAKAIPKDPNPHIDSMLQGFRDVINAQGGIGKLPAALKAAFLGKTIGPKALSFVTSYIEFVAKRGAAKKLGRTDLTGIDTHLNLSTGNMEVRIATPNGTVTQTVPIGDQITRVTKEFLNAQQAKGYRTLDFVDQNQHLNGIYRASPRPLRSSLQEDLSATGSAETVRLSDGKFAHWSELKPGQVAVTGNMGQVTLQAQRYLERLIAKFMPGEKLIINTVTNPDPKVGGQFLRYPNDFNMIEANARRTHDDSGHIVQTATMFHEMGHMLLHHAFKRESLATQIALYNAFQAEVATGKPVDVAYMTMGPDTTRGLGIGGTLDESGFLKWFNFDEWVCEQVARYFLTSERATGFVDKFFSGVAGKLKSLWASMFSTYEARTGQKYEANAAVASWLESMHRNRTTGKPILQPAAEEAMRESSLENLKWSNQKDTLNPLTNSLEDLVAAAPPEQPQSTAIRQTENVFNFVGTNRGQVAAQSDKYHWWIRATWNLLQIAQENPTIQTLQNYVGLVRQWSITRMHFISQANTTLKTWRRLGKDMSANLNAFLYDVDSMSYLPKGNRARWPTQSEEAALMAKHGLNPAAMGVYGQVRAQFSEVLDRLEKAWLASAAQIRDPIQQATKLMEINKQMQMLRVKPYFPHSRYGDWTLSVKNAKGKLVFFQQFESKRARDDAMGPARQQYPGHTITEDKTPGEMQQFSGIPPGILRDLQGRLGLTQQQQQVLDAFIFDMSPANSFAQKFQKRKNIKGFDINAQRAFANYFIHAAGHIARLEYGEPLQHAITDTRTTARGDLTGKRQGIADWMQRHLDYIMHPPNEWTAVRSVAFMHHLAWSPGAAFINLTQVPMVAVPYLSSRFGNLKIIPAFMKSGRDLRKMYDDPLNSRLPRDESDALEEGKTQGFLDQAQATELASASEGTTLMKILPGTQLQRGLAHLGHWSSYLFQAAEKVNRNITFMTAYRLAKENPAAPHLANLEAANTALVQDLLSKGWNPVNVRAFLAGRDAVDTTQFEYSRWNRPEFMRGKKGVIFTFYMYKQNMLHFFAHQPGGYKALALVLAFAGLQGLPWEEEANDLIRGITELLGLGRLDLNAEMRKFLAELTDRPDLIMHGLGRETWGLGLLGDAMGIPIPSVDVSGSMGFGQIDPLLTPIIHGLETGQNFSEQVGNVAMAAAGATIGVGLAYTKMLEGDLTQLRTWLPALPRYMKNVAQAFDLYNNSGYVNSAGAKLVPYDLTDTKTMAEILAQGLGFTPTRIAQKKELTAAELDAMKYWTMRRNILLDNLWKAFQAHEKEGIQHVMARIKFFNQTAPDPGLRLNSQSILTSIRNKAKGVIKQEIGIAPSRGLVGLQQQVQKLYPEAQ